MAVPGGTKLYTQSYQEADYPIPRAMEKSDIAKVIQEFATGAKNALEAGGLLMMVCMEPDLTYLMMKSTQSIVFFCSVMPTRS